MTGIIREERIGGQRLILGDCLQVMPMLGRFGACLTDPPYGIAFSRGDGGVGFGKKKRYGSAPDNLPVIAGDTEPFDPTQILALDIPTILWGANHYADKLPPSDRWLVWDKRRGTTTNDFADCELAWSNVKGPARMFWHMWNGGLRDSEQGIPRVHKTQKAIALMEWCIGFLPDAVTILDPFMGSGTTLVACQRIGRMGTGIELDEEYWRIACERVHKAWQQPDLLIADPKPSAPVQESFLDV